MLPPLLQSVRESLTIVGDLHGSLGDLNAVMGLHGRPSTKSRIIFNGDFVDRGPDEEIKGVLKLALEMKARAGVKFS